ncbi:MAG: hypothetical protein ACK4VI_02120 [Alphaproteobacteria bacterium]
MDAANSSEEVRKSINNTYEAHAYNTIINCLENEIIMSLCKMIEDGGKDRCSFTYALKLLNKPNNQQELTTLYFRGDKEKFDRLFKKTRRVLNKVCNHKKHKQAIIEYRNTHLAHSLNKDRINNFTYGNLTSFVMRLIPVVTYLLICMTGTQYSYDDRLKHNKKYSEKFWQRIV